MRSEEVLIIGKYRWPLELHFLANATVRLFATLLYQPANNMVLGGRICTEAAS